MRIIILFTLLFLFSCKFQKTEISLKPINDHSYKPIIYEDATQFQSKDSLFIYYPYVFELKNNSSSKFKIWDVNSNFDFGGFSPVIINKSYYNTCCGNEIIMIKKSKKIIYNIKLPISKSLFEKPLNEKLKITFKNDDNRDSIVLDKMNPNLEKEVNKLLEKERLVIHLNEIGKNNGFIMYHCLKSQKTVIYNADSLFQANSMFDFDCTTGKGNTLKLSK